VTPAASSRNQGFEKPSQQKGADNRKSSEERADGEIGAECRIDAKEREKTHCAARAKRKPIITLASDSASEASRLWPGRLIMA
jgi:hypothetical protein